MRFGRASDQVLDCQAYAAKAGINQRTLAWWKLRLASADAKEWGLGGAMVVITGFLFVYLVLGYIAA